jgi:hypothetical protein
MFLDGRSEKAPVIDFSVEYPREKFTTTSSDNVSRVVTGLFGDDDAVLRTVMLGSSVAVPHTIGKLFSVPYFEFTLPRCSSGVLTPTISQDHARFA